MINNNTRGSVWRKWDLHIHSNASDGKMNPQEIVDEACLKGIDVIALTDHHTFKNIDEIKRIAKDTNLSVISGVEFRTEYGSHSVHMIGLFPEKHKDIELDSKTLYDLVLSPLELSRAIIEQKGKDKNPNLHDDAAFKEGMFYVQVDFKKAADKIHEFGGIVMVHAGDKTNGIEKEMKHVGTADKNVKTLADSLGTVKEELLKGFIDICELSNNKESPDFYLEKFNRPSIIASDAHCKEDIGRQYTWIKADPTFSGLKQVIYEPSDRVSIQENMPEPKRDYNIIDRIEINYEHFGKQTIPFSQNLNAIIGGRSSGKSILLGSIASLVSTNITVKQNEEYQAYINQITKHMTLYWADGVTNGTRKIEYFPQSRINSLATDSEEITKILGNIIKSDASKSVLYSEYVAFSSAHTKAIAENVQDAFEYVRKIEEFTNALKSIGNKDGIIKEVEKIKNEIDKISSTMNLLPEDEEKYKIVTQDISECDKKIDISTKSVASLNDLASLEIVNKIDFQDILSSKDLASELSEEFRTLSNKFTTDWKENINKHINQEEQIIKCSRSEILDFKNSEIFKKYEEYFAKNQTLAEYRKGLKEEREKLNQIQEYEASVASYNNRLETCKLNISNNLQLIYDKINEVTSELRMSRDDVEIFAKVEFKQNLYNQIIETFVDSRFQTNAALINYSFDSFDSFDKFLSLTGDLLNNLLKGQVTLKSQNSNQALATRFFNDTLFEIKFDVNYQGDTIDSMSEGKKAFIILKMLLDFSNDQFPIMIDQPEDDLDNRAIYHELAKYVKNKKKERQIILVTHNPNIVVGADAEEIIVANQHGIGNENQDCIKFEYLSGSLETSFRDESKKEILLRQGIKEHVCDILEGGDIAFKKRENKYKLS